MTEAPRHSADLVLRGHFDVDEQSTFRHVAFDVPDGVDQLHIAIDYNDRISSDPRQTGGNTLDIGLFDERGIDAGGSGFRGWSGSARDALTVGTGWATPPYRSERPGAGAWHLLLAPYKVAAHGLDYEARVWFDPGIEGPVEPAVPEPPRPRSLPRPPEPGWYRGDLHAHTVYSDGSSTPTALAIAAVEAGLDFFGITDHNRAQSPIDLVPSGPGWPVVVPGVEVTTYAGHFNVWGTDAWYEFRDPTPGGMQRAVDAARADGGLVSINHPKPFGPEWLFPEVEGFDCLEAWNGWWGRLNTRSLDEWDRRLREGERLVGVCGSDIHHPDLIGEQSNPLSPVRIGCPTLWVEAGDTVSPDAIVAAIRAGRCFMSESPAGPHLYWQRQGDALVARLAGAAGDAVMLIGDPGVIATAPIAGDDVSFRWTRDELAGNGANRYIRAQVVDRLGNVRALSNPIWLDGDDSTGVQPQR